MIGKIIGLICSLLVLAGVAGCAPEMLSTPIPATGAMAATPAIAPTATLPVQEQDTTQSSDLASIPVVAQAIDDVTQQLEVGQDEISIQRVEEVEWPDASLGCPQPDMMYAQVITPGFRIELEVAGETVEVHTDQGNNVVLCEDASKSTEVIEEEAMSGEPALSSPQDPVLSQKVTWAKEDLSNRLAIPAAQIDLLEVREVTWPDAGLGCPQPGMVYAQMLQDGLLIRLRAGGEMYFYHSGGNQDPFLCESTSQMAPKATPKSDEFVPPPDSEID